MSSRAGTAVGDRTATRPRLDVEAVVAAAPVVVVIGVGTARKGAFFSPDVVVLPCLCLALALVSPVVVRRLAGHPIPVLAGAAATGYWVVAAGLHGRGIESWRMAATWLAAAAGYAAVRGLDGVARRAVTAAVVAGGLLIALTGLALIAARAPTWTLADERSLRFAGPLTYPSAIGMYLLLALVASSQLTTRRDGSIATVTTTQRRGRKLLATVQAVIALGAVATDSRGTVVGLIILGCLRSSRAALWPAFAGTALAAPLLLAGQRGGVRPVLVLAAVAVAGGVAWAWRPGLGRRLLPLAVPALAVAGFLLATQHRLVSGFDASWTERGHILRGAFRLLAAHPLLGAGPDPWIPTRTLTDAPGVDAFTHNEPLELLVSVGVVGVVMLAAAALLVGRSLWATRSAAAAPVLAVVATCGLVDFVWHFPVLGLLAGVVAAAGRPRSATVGHGWRPAATRHRFATWQLPTRSWGRRNSFRRT